MAAATAFATARFDLRPLESGDGDALFSTLSNEAQCRFLTRGAFATPGDLWAWLADPDWNGRTWIAVDRESGQVTARFVAVPAHDHGVIELGWITVGRWQGRGVASECVAALIGQLFGAEDLRKLTAEVDAENAASIALLHKLGFSREAHFRQHEHTHIGLRDVEMFGLLASEWRGEP